MPPVLSHLTLTASRVRCRLLDDVATVKVKQNYVNNSDAAVTAKCVLPSYPAGKLIGLYINQGEYASNSSNTSNSNTDGNPSSTVPQPEFPLLLPVKPQQIMDVTLEYMVVLTRDEESELTFRIPPDLVPVAPECSMPLRVPDWEMPTVRNPSSLYDRASTGDDNVLGPAFSATKPSAAQSEGDDVDWSVSAAQQGVGPEDNEEQNAKNSSKFIAKEADVVVQISVEAYLSKGVADITVTGQPQRKNVTDRHAEIFITQAHLNPGEFSCTVREARRKLIEPVLWRQADPDLEPMAARYKLVMDTVIDDPTNDRESPGFDIIILIDGSSAMGSVGMINVRRALKLLLNALPTNCRFNVHGFAENWSSKFFDSPVSYSEPAFSTARSGIERMRETQRNPAQYLLPVLESALGGQDATLTNANANANATRIILVSGSPDAKDICEVSARLSSHKIPLYGVLVNDGGWITSETERTARRLGGCCERVTEFDLLDQALLQQLRRSCATSHVVSVHANLSGPSREESVPLVQSDRCIDSFYSEDSTSYIPHNDFASIDITVDGVNNQVKSKRVLILDIRPTIGDHLIQLAAEDAQSIGAEKGIPSKYLEIRYQDEAYTRVPCQTMEAAKPMVPRDVALARQKGLSRPWQMALVDDSLSDSSSDESNLFENVAYRNEHHDFTDSLPKRSISMKAGFDLVSQRLSKAVQYDGTVSWKLAAGMLRLPKRPRKGVNADVWATVLTMTYIKLENRTDDPCWEMFLDKAWQRICTLSKDDSDRGTMFQHAIRELQAIRHKSQDK